jgi:hypothetical protein
MKKPAKRILLFMFISMLLFTACTPFKGEGAGAPVSPSPFVESEEQTITRTGEKKILVTGSMARKDTQGNVTVVITPQDLSQVDETLDFDVVLDTHSVELSMDLADLATLTTDTGKSVNPSQWDAPSGGHHVKGTLTFPAIIDDATLLDEGSTITLTLRNVDVPVRVFTWTIPLD